MTTPKTKTCVWCDKTIGSDETVTKGLCSACRSYKYKLKHEFGMTLEDFDIMAEEQNHKCALCRGVNVNNRRLIVDHDHDTGEVRGLLCYSCNYRLSLAERYPSFFIKCLKYLKKI